jgi:hypothetical protein
MGSRRTPQFKRPGSAGERKLARPCYGLPIGSSRRSHGGPTLKEQVSSEGSTLLAVLRRLLTVGLLAGMLGVVATPPARAHTLPFSYAKSKAKTLIKKHFRDYPWSFNSVIASTSNCKRLSDHKVRCTALADGGDGQTVTRPRQWK